MGDGGRGKGRKEREERGKRQSRGWEKKTTKIEIFI